MLLIIPFALGASAYEGTTNVSIQTVPDWVELCEWSVPTNWSQAQNSEAVRNLVYERQENPAKKESFTRVVVLMENPTGVQDSGSLTFDFDPGYQELTIHSLAIYREGHVLNRLDRSKIRIIQPEPDLNGHVLTGRQSALIFVEDLRVGDILEYAYTLRGANPVLSGHYAARIVVQMGVPVQRERIRVVWTSASPLYLRQHLTDQEPNKQLSVGGTNYIWDFENLPGISYEGSTPAGYEPYPYIELTDFSDWSRVVDWALPLYSSVPSNLPPELGELIARWEKESSSNEERARLAVGFVQDDLRYTGIELGPDSFRPADPSETFRLRYGDCKGKALLLCTILRAMNIEAYPALVNASARANVARRLPSPFAFDHAIVKILLDGNIRWVDATQSHQGGMLSERYLPPYGKALLLKKGENSLQDIPTSDRDSRQIVTSTFKLKDYEKPASFTVSTLYYGSRADEVREYFARTDSKETSKNYLNYYARYYPGIRETGPLEIKDERLRNVLEVTEHYQITNLWAPNKSSRRLEATFYADSLEKMLTDPDIRLRTMPLGLQYPSRREQNVIVYLPDGDWDIPSMEQSVDCGEFLFHYNRNASGSDVRFHYDCNTRTSSVPAGKVSEYLKKLEEMQNLLEDTLYRPGSRSAAILSQINWPMLVVFAFGLAASLAGGIWYWRAANAGNAGVELIPSLPPVIGDERLRGLGGWLLVVGFGLCVSVAWRTLTFAKNWEGFFGLSVWQMFAAPGGEHYHGLFAPLLIFEVIGNTVFISLNVLAVCLFFGRRRSFPKAYMMLLIGSAIFLLLDEVAANSIPYLASQQPSTSSRDLSRAILQAIIWCSYIVKSRRVKLTFVR